MSERRMETADNVASVARRAILDDYEVLEGNNARLTKQCAELRETNQRLMQEVALLRDHLDARTRDFNRIQAYSVRLTAQLDVIVGVIAQSKRDAEAHGARATGTTGPTLVELAKDIMGDRSTSSTLPRASY